MSELHFAANSCNPGWVQTRIARGDDVNELDDRGRTPLMWVCLRGCAQSAVACARLLLAAGALPDKVAPYGSSCLHMACDASNVELVRLLLDMGASPNFVVDDVSPLMCAMSAASEEIATLLLDRGADVHYEFSNRTARDYAYRYGLLALARRIELEQQAAYRGSGHDAA